MVMYMMTCCNANLAARVSSGEVPMSMKTAAGLSVAVAKPPHDCQVKRLRRVCDNLNAHIYAGVPARPCIGCSRSSTAAGSTGWNRNGAS